MSGAERRKQLGKERSKLRLVTCQHFTGVQHDTCKAGVAYKTVRGNAPCSLSCFRDKSWEEGGKPACAHFIAITEEQVTAEMRELERTIGLYAKKLSSCCEAPLDETYVITQGRNRGHGPRFCSKCRRVVMWV